MPSKYFVAAAIILALLASLVFAFSYARAATCTGTFFGGTGICYPLEWADGAIPFGSDSNPLATSSSLTFATSTNTLSTGSLTLSNALAASYGGTGSTTLSGILKGNGTGVVKTAVGDTDYQKPITLTTTGSSGAATFSGDVLNIPQYSGGSSSGGIATSSPWTNGYIAEVVGNGTVSSVATSTLSAGTGLTGSFTQIGSGGSLALSVPVTIADGGIGTTTSPTYGQLLIGDSNGNYELVATSSLGIAGTNYWSLSGSYLYNNAGTYIGIGATTPTHTLQVYGTGGTGGFGFDPNGYFSQQDIITGTTGASRWYMIGTSTTGAQQDIQQIYENASGANAIQFLTTGTSYFDGGDLAINKTSASYPLDVAGFINTDQYSGYKQNGGTILYASSTYSSVAVGNLAGGNITSSYSTNGGETSVGYEAMESEIAGYHNTAIGAVSLLIGSSSIFANNTAVGDGAGEYASTTDSTYMGVSTGSGSSSANPSTGTNETALGYGAMRWGSSGSNNTAVGLDSLFSANTSPSFSNETAVGYTALEDDNAGYRNVAVGYGALQLASSSAFTGNVGMGFDAGEYASTSNSIFIGDFAGQGVAAGPYITGDHDIAIGNLAGDAITTGSDNILLTTCTTTTCSNQVSSGAQNIAIGYNVAVPSATTNGQLDIQNIIYGTGNTAVGASVSTGNIGIGTSSPFQTLSTGGNLYIGASSAGGTLGNLYIPSQESAGGSYLAVNPFGEVIATSTPTGASVAGSYQQLQFNAGSVFGASDQLAFSTTSSPASGPMLTIGANVTGENGYLDLKSHSVGNSNTYLTGPSAGGGLTFTLPNGASGTLCATGNTDCSTSVSNSDGTLTISPTTGAVVASLNLGNANTWTALQQFSNATSTLFTSTGNTWLGTTAQTAIGTTTLNSGSEITIGGPGTLSNPTYSKLLDIEGGYVNGDGIYVKTRGQSGAGAYSTIGIYSENNDAATGGVAIKGIADNTGGSSFGVYGVATNGTGVYGDDAGTGYGVEGQDNNSSGRAIYATQGNASGYSLYAAGGINYLQDNTGVGTTTPFANLSVSSAAALSPTALLFDVASTTNSTLFSINAAGGISLTEQLPATSTAMTLDWSRTPPQVDEQIGTSATTITLINATTSQFDGSRKLVLVCNPNGTAGALTWKGVEWAGGVAPTQTTTANQCDAYSFFVTYATSTTAWKVFGAASLGFQ